MDIFSVYNGLDTFPINALKDENVKKDVLDMIDLHGRDDEGVWDTKDAEVVLDRIMAFQIQVIQKVKLVAPEGIRQREVDQSRMVYLVLFLIRRQIMALKAT